MAHTSSRRRNYMLMNHVRCKPAGQRSIFVQSLPESTALLLVVTDWVGAARVASAARAAPGVPVPFALASAVGFFYSDQCLSAQV